MHGSSAGSVVIVGAGPGIGGAVARRFAREGFAVALLARQQQTLSSLAETLRPYPVPVATVTADATDEKSLRAGLDQAGEQLGPADVAVYNAAVIRADHCQELTMDQILGTWAVNVGGAVITAGHLLPAMASRGSGTFLITGGMPAPVPGYATLSLGKSGVRTLVSLLDGQFGPSGVHVASVTVTDAVVPGTAHDPELIAEHYWRLHVQPRGQWDHEVTH
jgi:NADP-dependent 3-hydroxy acid dehydrogenase YdfG